MTEADREQLDRLLDGDLSPDKSDAAQKLLEGDADAMAYFAGRAMLVSDLRRSLKRRRLQSQSLALVGETAHEHSRDRVLSMPRWVRSRIVWAAAAVLIAVGLAALLLHRPAGDHKSDIAGKNDVVVEVIESQDVASAQHWQPGTRVPLRQISLASGRVGLRLPGGVSLDLAGPLEAELVSAGELRLSLGNVIATANEQGRGFVVQTSSARVIDRGTRFGVTASAASQTDVVVFDGNVEIADPAQGSASSRPLMTLTEGEAIRLDGSKKPQRLKMIALGADARSLGGGIVSDLVADVKDNVVASDFHRYYGLLRGGMGEGARLYTTGHTRTWHALPGRPFPGELIGADVICTFSTDRREENLEITLVLKEPCELFVLADARSPAPVWLRESFTDTGLQLRSGPWVPRASLPETPATPLDESAYVPHTVWKKMILQPGPVVLGSPRTPDNRGPQVMYGIAVKKLP